MRQGAAKEFQVHGFLRVVVPDLGKEFADVNLHTQFLADLAHETLLEALAGFALAAGEFPQPAEVRVRVPLGDEQMPAAKDEGGTDFEEFMIHDLRLTNDIRATPTIVNRISKIVNHLPMLL